MPTGYEEEDLNRAFEVVQNDDRARLLAKRALDALVIHAAEPSNEMEPGETYVGKPLRDILTQDTVIHPTGPGPRTVPLVVYIAGNRTVLGVAEIVNNTITCFLDGGPEVARLISMSGVESLSIGLADQRPKPDWAILSKASRERLEDYRRQFDRPELKSLKPRILPETDTLGFRDDPLNLKERPLAGQSEAYRKLLEMGLPSGPSPQSISEVDVHLNLPEVKTDPPQKIEGEPADG